MSDVTRLGVVASRLNPGPRGVGFGVRGFSHEVTRAGRPGGPGPYDAGCGAGKNWVLCLVATVPPSPGHPSGGQTACPGDPRSDQVLREQQPNLGDVGVSFWGCQSRCARDVFLSAPHVPGPGWAAATVQSVGVRVPSSVGPWGPHPGPAPGWRSLLPPGPGRYADPAGFGADLDPCGAFHC